MGRLRSPPCGALVTSLLSLLLHISSSAAATPAPPSSGTLLHKRTVNDSLAICNDRTPAIYYVHQYANSTRWVVFFESGGVCSDADSCQKRYSTDRILMSSAGFPDSITGEDLLSAEPGESPFEGFNRVLVPYCSSDLFLGQNVTAGGIEFNASDSSTYAFAGRHIARGVLLELHGMADATLGRLGLRSATEVVLAGSSAGGLGALNVARHVRQSLVPSGARISVLVDSSWFVDFYGRAKQLFSEQMVQWTAMADGYHPCQKTDGPSRCCVSCSCLVEDILPRASTRPAGNTSSGGSSNTTSSPCGLGASGGGGSGVATSVAAVSNATARGDIHIMLLVSRYDLFILGRALEDMKRAGRLGGNGATASTVITKATEAVDNYGGIMSGTLERASYGNVRFSYVETSCAQHLYIAASSLWANKSSLGANAVRSYDFGAIHFNTEVKRGNWKKVEVNGLSLQQHVFKWYDTVVNAPPRSSSRRGYIVSDSCSGILCNKKCTDSIEVTYSTASPVSKVFQRTMEALCVALLLICCLVKVLLYLEVKRLAYLMNKFSKHEDSDGKAATFNCLPECPDFGRVSIACHCLNYIVPISSSSQQTPLLTNQTIDESEEDIDDIDGDSQVLYEVGSRLAERENNTPFQRNSQVRVSRVVSRPKTSVMSRGQFMEQQQEVLRNKMQRYFQSAEEASVSTSYRLSDNLTTSTATQDSEKEQTTVDYVTEISTATNSTTNTMTTQLMASCNGAMPQGNGGQANGNQANGNQANGNQANGNQANGNQANGNQADDSQANGCQSNGYQPSDLPVEDGGRNSQLMTSFLAPSMSSKGRGKLMSRLSSVKSSVGARRKSKEKVKVILNNVTTYFNAGQLVAVMGPSGSGKTTFMDLITGRKTDENVSGQIIVNGRYLEELAAWYKQNTGYVLQLATPYYDELTVKENLLYSAMMRVPADTTQPDIFERIDLVMREVGLFESANTVVGGAVGGGLSGGQKRRLSVAIQLIRMPNVLFLDEPTSGLDAHSSLELIRMLSVVAKGGRLVVMSIHQPRLEIYHMFDSILFMCTGKVAFYGSPIRAPDFFLEALQNIPHESIDDDELANPADVIMDLLNSKINQKQIIDFYESSEEPSQVEVAVLRNIQDAQYDRGQLPSGDTQQASVWMRLIGLEGRYSRLKWGSLVYLPIIVITFGLGIGVAYRNTTVGFLLAASYNILTGVSFLFITPYYVKLILGRMLHVFSLEHDDGVCRAVEFVFHTFLNAVAVTILPLTIMSTLVYVMIAPERDTMSESIATWFIITLINLMSNAVSLSIVIAITCAVPRYAIELSHIACGYVTFFEGFLYTLPDMASFLRWAVYPNPYFWAFSGEMKALLGNVTLKCDHASPIRCFDKEGDAVLTAFGFEDSDPHMSLLVLLCMVPLFLLLSVMALLSWDEFFSMFMIKNTSTAGAKICCAGEPVDTHVKGDEAAALVFADDDVEAGLGKRAQSETPDVFATVDSGGPGEVATDEEMVVVPGRRLSYGRSFSMPASALSSENGDDIGVGMYGARSRRPSVNTLTEYSEPHVVQGGSAFMRGNDLLTAQLRLKSMSRSSASASGRPDSGSSSVFNPFSMHMQKQLQQQQQQPQQVDGASRPSSLTPGVFPVGSSQSSPSNQAEVPETPAVPPPPPPSNENSKFFFPGTRRESEAVNAKLLAEKLEQSISTGNVSRERREHMAKLHARRRERLLSANLALRRSQSNAQSYNHSLATTPATPGTPAEATMALTARHRRSDKSTLSLGLSTPAWEREQFLLQMPPGGKQARPAVLRSAPVTPHGARPGSNTPTRFSPVGMRHALYRGHDAGNAPPAVPSENRRRPQSLVVDQPSSSTSLPGTPLRHFQGHPLAAGIDGHGSKLASGSSMALTPRRSPDLKQHGTEHYGGSLGVSPRRQTRVDQRTVELLRGSGGSSTTSYLSDSGSATGPTFSSSSSGDNMDPLTPISPLVGALKLPRGKRLGASSLSQERSLSIGPTPAGTPDVSTVAEDKSLATTPGASKLQPGTPFASGGVQYYLTLSPGESDDAESPNSPAGGSGASTGRPRPPRLTRRKSCQPRVESGVDFGGDVLSPIHEASPTPSPQSTLKKTKSADDLLSAAIAAAEIPTAAQGLKSILRKGPRSQSQDGGKAGVVFTEHVHNSLRAEQDSGTAVASAAAVRLSPARDPPQEHTLPPPAHSANMASSAGGGNTSSTAEVSGRSSRAATWIATTRYDPIAEMSMENESMRSVSRQVSRDVVHSSSEGGMLTLSQDADVDDADSARETAV